MKNGWGDEKQEAKETVPKRACCPAEHLGRQMNSDKLPYLKAKEMQMMKERNVSRIIPQVFTWDSWGYVENWVPNWDKRRRIMESDHLGECYAWRFRLNITAYAPQSADYVTRHHSESLQSWNCEVPAPDAITQYAHWSFDTVVGPFLSVKSGKLEVHPEAHESEIFQLPVNILCSCMKSSVIKKSYATS